MEKASLGRVRAGSKMGEIRLVAVMLDALDIASAASKRSNSFCWRVPEASLSPRNQAA